MKVLCHRYEQLDMKILDKDQVAEQNQEFNRLAEDN